MLWDGTWDGERSSPRAWRYHGGAPLARLHGTLEESQPHTGRWRGSPTPGEPSVAEPKGSASLASSEEGKGDTLHRHLSLNFRT